MTDVTAKAAVAEATAKQKKPLLTQRQKSKFIDFLFVLPALALLAVFTYYPVAKLFQISFTDWNLLKPEWNFVGLKNWKWLFVGSGAKYLWNSLKVTFLYSLGEIFATMVGGMIFALIFKRMTRSFSAMRAILFVPKYVAMSSCAVVFLWILNTDYGVLNYLLKLIGLQPVDWLNQESTALLSVLMTTCWRVFGYGMMIYLSAMMGISPQYYEAASLDGANSRQQFFKITLPMLSPQLFMLLITITTGSFKVFDSIRIMTNGGPGTSTQVLCMFIYEFAFNRNNSLGMGAAGGVMLMLILILITLFDFKGLEKKVHYQ